MERRTRNAIFVAIVFFGLIFAIYALAFANLPMILLDEPESTHDIGIKTTVEEAQANIPFDILEPTYLPRGYKLDYVEMIDPNPKYNYNNTMITLYYSNGNDSFKLTEDIGLGIGSNLLESTVTVMINGQEGRLFVVTGTRRYENCSIWQILGIGQCEVREEIKEYQRLYWEIGDIGLILFEDTSGSLCKDEMIRIAKSVG